jgi:hypothetical protein
MMLHERYGNKRPGISALHEVSYHGGKGNWEAFKVPPY